VVLLQLLVGYELAILEWEYHLISSVVIILLCTSLGENEADVVIIGRLM